MRFFYLFTIITIFLFPATLLAQENTTETSITPIFNESFFIAANHDIPNYPLVFDYAAEIFKKKPKSLEAWYTVMALVKITISPKNRYTLQTKYKEYKSKYFETINDLNSDLIEKLILAFMLYEGLDDVKSMQMRNELFTLGKETLIKIKERCKNTDLEGLTTSMASLLHTPTVIKNYKDFIKENPNHIFVPGMDLEITIGEELILKNDPLSTINKCLELITKYKSTITPFGYSIANDYYSMVVKCYTELNDYSKAKEYIDIIKKDAPNYWELKDLETELNTLKKP